MELEHIHNQFSIIVLASALIYLLLLLPLLLWGGSTRRPLHRDFF
jgi:hypothetical protein